MDTGDWRLRGQEDYLMGATLIHKKFNSNRPKVLMPNEDPRQYSDHEHCDFCWHKITENCEHEEECSTHGYCTLDGRTWICETCFEDFKELFSWTIEDDTTDQHRHRQETEGQVEITENPPPAAQHNKAP